MPRIDEMEVLAEEFAYWEYSDLEDGEGPFPIYLFDDKNNAKLYTSSRDCFDCTRRGGSNIQPEYWE